MNSISNSNNLQLCYFGKNLETPNNIAMNNNIKLKTQFIKEKYHFISWEENVRNTKPIQLVSNLYTESIKIKFNSIVEFTNDKSIKLFESKQFTNKHRIVVNLDEFNESTLYYQKIISSFLNNICKPTNEMWNKLADQGAKYSKQWKMDDKGFICLAAPSLGYLDEHDNIKGLEFKEYIENTFKKIDNLYGSNLHKNLIVESHKRACFYFFKNQFVCDELIKLAKAHEEAAHQLTIS
ncbi:MAG: hypothetical protein H0V82_00890 [Candidatus Protochlamydia sp.]|nr:hypothetical protein [Candidatus Protochlamydia sp.]